MGNSRLNHRDGKAASRITCVEPFPSDRLRSRKEVELIPQVSQQVPLSLFDQLSSGDLLFIDSSHAVKIGSDVLRIYLEIIPRRAPRIFTQMNIHINTIKSQWYCAGCAFGRSTGGIGKTTTPALRFHPIFNNAAFMEEHGPRTTTVTIRGNTSAGPCPVGLRSPAVSLGPVTNTSGMLSAPANVTTIEYGMQGVVFAIDGHYVSAVMGGGPYKLSYGAAGLPSGAHTVTATVVGCWPYRTSRMSGTQAELDPAARSALMSILHARISISREIRTTLLTDGGQRNPLRPAGVDVASIGAMGTATLRPCPVASNA